eukprot:4862728-Ditylum_brightwellii.AAC.1
MVPHMSFGLVHTTEKVLANVQVMLRFILESDAHARSEESEETMGCVSHPVPSNTEIHISNSTDLNDVE